MPELKYKFKHDVLFKSLFVKHKDLLENLVADLLQVPIESIGKIEVRNSEMPPEAVGDKFCRLDINMTVGEERVDVEIQVNDEGDYVNRTLYYWAREFSTALGSGGKYSELPRTVIISIINFKLFDSEDVHSEYIPLEVERHTPLTDRMSFHYYELPKLPKYLDTKNRLQLWLRLFDAETEEELTQIEETGVPIMEQAISAYRHITATKEFQTLARMREDARHNEASALDNARRKEAEKWQGVVADKDAEWQSVVANKDAENARLREQLAAMQAKIESASK